MATMAYRGLILTAVEQPNGGFQVEIVPVEGGKSVLTSRFAEQFAAMASARAIIDKGVIQPG